MATQYSSEVFELIIRDERSGGFDDDTTNGGADIQGIGANKRAKKVTTTTLINFEISKTIATQLVTSLSSRVGSLTGNVLAQNQINSALRVASYGAAMLVNPVLGGLMTVLDLSMQAIDRNVEIFWKNTEASEYRRRSGNYLTDRNR